MVWIKKEKENWEILIIAIFQIFENFNFWNMQKQTLLV